MTKHNLLNQWFWKWHVMAGLITLPFMLLLAVTGSIYLFKDDVNNNIYQDIRFVEQPINAQRLPLEEQLSSARLISKAAVVGITLSSSPEQATAFQVAGKGWARNNLYVDPYTGEVKGEENQKESLMYLVRKLHGELLLNQVGTLVIELVASWFIVLIITGLYIWWPNKGSGAAGFFTVRLSMGKRILFRDLHAVVGFWLSAFMLIILMGGMPWTDVFGSQLKWVQKQTDAGYPTHWQNAKGLTSPLTDNQELTPLSLDEVVKITQSNNLDGVISIKFPSSAQGVFTIANRSLLLRDQHVIHINQYSGDTVKSLQWDDVGFLMDLRQVFMRLHQGEYGKANWAVLLVVALSFIITTVAGLVSYLMRKPQGNWGVPTLPSGFNVDKLLLVLIIFLGGLFPMFGISLIIIFTWGKLKKLKFSNQPNTSNG
jgi:uncharacterized iron-regulated membrane protein|tara:strand:- start:5608 stop:6891 length:1284 start_codon:yes stop_codon:yes gene_type:complete